MSKVKNLKVVCPSCSAQKSVKIGILPDVKQFSGRLLDAPLHGGSLYVCQKCFLKFRYPLLTEDEYGLLYDNATPSSWPSDVFRKDWDLIAKFINANIPADSRVLDFGCWTGGLLSKIGSKYQRFGVEVNSSAGEIASERIGGKVWKCLDGMPDDLEFDVITIVDVIEHLPDPRKIVKQLLNKLRENGYMLIVTGDADNFVWRLSGANWWYCFHPEHIAFISEKWARRFEKEGGFKIEAVVKFQHGKFPLPIYLLRVAQMFIYSLTPRFYFRLFGVVRRILNRKGEVVGPAGVGLFKDHILVVVAKR